MTKPVKQILLFRKYINSRHKNISGYQKIQSTGNKENPKYYSTVCWQAHSPYRCGGRLSRRYLENGMGVWETKEEPGV